MVGTVVTRVEIEVKRGKEGSDVYTEERWIFPLVCFAEWFTEGHSGFCYRPLKGLSANN